MTSEHDASAVEHRESMLTLIRRAVAGGGDDDYTSGSIDRAVVLLAVPMILEMVMESVFAVCDVFYVSRLGTDAVAAVGLTEAVVTLVYAVAVGLSAAATAMVARRIGEGDREAASIAAGQSLLLGVLVAIPITAAGFLFASDILRLMGGSPELVAGGAGYTRWLLVGSGSILALFLLNAALRGAGDAVWSMRVLWVANGLNIVLDPCLIWGWGPFPELGLTGAAVATTIGRTVGVGLQLWILWRGRGRLRLSWDALRPRPDILGRLFRVSLGGIGQYLISTASWVGLVRIVSTFGSSAVAGYTVAVRIVLFAVLPSWGVSNAASTLMGQNLGAGKPDRAARSVLRTGWLNMWFLVFVGIVFLVFAEPLVRIFVSDPDVVRVATHGLRIFSVGYPLYAWGMVLIQAFNGAGDTRTPLRVNFVCFWMLELPLAWMLATRTGLGPDGPFWAVIIAESVMMALAMWLFRRGGWRSRTI